jgi:hypothetical protein
VGGFVSPTTTGVSHSFTVTAQDAFGNMATGYTGTVTFTSSDGLAALPANYTFVIDDSGVHAFNATLNTVGSQSITATDTVTGSIKGSQTGIKVSAPASILVVGGFASPTTAGVSHNFTVTAQDAFGNTATSYSGTVTFTSSDGLAGLPANYTFVSGDAGVHSFSATFRTAGTQSITATDTATSTIKGSQTGITVNPAAASTFVVGGFASPTIAGVSHNFTVTAQDAFGNTATGYTGTVTFTSSDGSAGLPANYTFVNGDAGLHSFSASLKTAGTQSITATDTPTSTIKGSQTGITVNPAAASTLVVGGFASPTIAGVSHNFTVTAQDAFGNTATSYTGTVTFTSSDGSAGLPANYTFVSGDAGVHTFSATLNTAGSQSITATDTANNSVNGKASVTVNATAASHFSVLVPSSVTAGATFSITVTALDPFQNTATSYTGTIQISTSGYASLLPAPYTFKPGDNGVHSFQMKMNTIGSQSISVVDTNQNSIQGRGTLTVNPSVLSSLVGRVSQSGQWWVGASNGSSFANSLWATWNANVTWVDVQTGDFNGDGRQDIVGRDAATGNWWVGLSTGSSFDNQLWGNWSPTVTWVDVHVGDFTGDGKADIVGRYAQTGQWWMAQSTGSSFVNSLWATWNPNVTWVDVQVGDFNGDGKADITGRYLQGGSWWTGISTSSSFQTNLWASWNPNVTWVDVTVGDFNGDGKADIVGRYLQSGQWFVGLSNGTSFDTSLWATWNPNVTWVNVVVGDFNGDGKADIIGRYTQTGQWWVAQSTGSLFVNSLWATWNPNVTWVDVQVGDFNGDGLSDITGRVAQNGQWWAGISTNSSLHTNLWANWNPNVSWVDVHNGDFA